jgi:hypothetical protein
MGIYPPLGGPDVGHPIQWRRLAKLAVGLPVMGRAEPHDAVWIVVVDVVALRGLGATDLAGLTLEIASSYLVDAVASCVAFRVLLAHVWTWIEV